MSPGVLRSVVKLFFELFALYAFKESAFILSKWLFLYVNQLNMNAIIEPSSFDSIEKDPTSLHVKAILHSSLDATKDME